MTERQAFIAKEMEKAGLAGLKTIVNNLDENEAFQSALAEEMDSIVDVPFVANSVEAVAFKKGVGYGMDLLVKMINKIEVE